MRSEQQIVIPEDLKAGEPSEVTGQLSSGEKNTLLNFYSDVRFTVWRLLPVRRKDFVTLWTVFDADAALMQTQTLYTEATPEQLEQLQQQGIQYDVITFTDE